jgi:hypothetical protein
LPPQWSTSAWLTSTSDRSSPVIPIDSRYGTITASGRVGQPGVDEEAALVAAQEELAHEPRAEIGLDPVDPGADLHASASHATSA